MDIILLVASSQSFAIQLNYVTKYGPRVPSHDDIKRTLARSPAFDSRLHLWQNQVVMSCSSYATGRSGSGDSLASFHLQQLAVNPWYEIDSFQDHFLLQPISVSQEYQTPSMPQNSNTSVQYSFENVVMDLGSPDGFDASESPSSSSSSRTSSISAVRTKDIFIPYASTKKAKAVSTPCNSDRIEVSKTLHLVADIADELKSADGRRIVSLKPNIVRNKAMHYQRQC